MIRGELIAHYLESRLRAAFENDYWAKEAERKSKGPGREGGHGQFEAMKKLWGV